MADNDIVEIDITIANAGPSRAGFGLPLMLTHDAPWVDLLRLYEDASDAVTDGFPSDSPVVRGLRKLFSQNPKPPLVAVGRASAAVIQQYTVGVQGAAKNSFTYAMNAAGEGFEDSAISYESDATATPSEIHNALLTQLNAVAAKNYTATFAPLVFPDQTFTADGATDVVTTSGVAPATGAGPFQLTTTLADLPLNLLIATDYWFIKTGASTGFYATSLANALAGVHIDIGDAGTGVHTISDTVNTKDPSQPFLVTGNASSDWFSLQVVNSTALSNKQTHTVAGIDADLDAIRNVNKDWYVLLTHFNSKDYVGDVATWCAANKVVYPFDVVDTDTINDAYQVGVTTDVGSTQLAAGYSFVAGAYHPTPAEFFAHSWMGRWLPTIPGQSNPAWRTLEGPSPTLLTSPQKTNLLARRMNYYRHAYGQNFTWEGTVFSTVYKYIDVRRNADWLENTMLTNIVGRLVGAEGVGFDQPGIQVIAGGAEAALSEGTDQGVLVANPKYTLEVPLAETIPTNDKGERALKKLKWSGQMRGFINKVVPVKGTLTF